MTAKLYTPSMNFVNHTLQWHDKNLGHRQGNKWNIYSKIPVTLETWQKCVAFQHSSYVYCAIMASYIEFYVCTLLAVYDGLITEDVIHYGKIKVRSSLSRSCYICIHLR